MNKNKESKTDAFRDLGYSLGSTIGKGQYSRIRMATDVEGRKLACKIITPKYLTDPRLTKFVFREMDILRKVNHQNIIKLHSVEYTSKRYFLFMDYCQHGDLLEYLQDVGALQEIRTQHLFRQIASAIHYLHHLDIAHRDIKCDNIFLWSPEHLKLGDFGFARFCKTSLGKEIVSNTFCGSAAYAPPEVLRGECYDPKKYDIWSLGCVLFIMLTASMPFDDSNIMKMLRDQLDGGLKLAIFAMDISLELKHLLNSLIEADLHRRVDIQGVVDHKWARNIRKCRFKSRSNL